MWSLVRESKGRVVNMNTGYEPVYPSVTARINSIFAKKLQMIQTQGGLFLLAGEPSSASAFIVCGKITFAFRGLEWSASQTALGRSFALR